MENLKLNFQCYEIFLHRYMTIIIKIKLAGKNLLILQKLKKQGKELYNFQLNRNCADNNVLEIKKKKLFLKLKIQNIFIRNKIT